MRLTACGVVAMADTIESAKEARTMLPEYMSASCQDVMRRVDECIELRARLKAAEEVIRTMPWREAAQCEQFHYSKKDQHKWDEECKPRARFIAALAKYEQERK